MRDARDLSSVPVPNDMTVIEDEHPHADARLSGDARGHHGNSGSNGKQADLAHLSSPIQLGCNTPSDGDEYAGRGASTAVMAITKWSILSRCDGGYSP